MQRDISNKMLLAFLVIFTNIVPPLSVDEYTPSIPHMLAPLHTTAAMMQLTVTVYMLAFAVSQMICGPLSDSFGRRKILLFNLPIYFIGTLICIFAHSGFVLILGRVIQGLGVGALALTGPAVMSDCFKGKELLRISARYSTIYSFIIISAPVIGGFIQQWLDWQGNFVFMFVLGVIIFATFYFLFPETHPVEKRHHLSMKNIRKSYFAVLTNKKYMAAVICLVLTWTMLVVFSVMAPFLIQNKLHFSPAQYGLLALLVGVGFFVGNTINNFLLKIFLPVKIMLWGFFIMLAMSLIQTVLPLLGFFNIYTVMLPVCIMMAGAGLGFGYLYGSAASAVPQYAGTAGALIGSLILIGAVIITALITQLEARSPIDMAAVFLVLSLMCLAIYRFMFEEA